MPPRTRSKTASQITHIRPPRTLDNIPLELFWLITEYLDIYSLDALRHVSKALKAKTKTAWLCSRVHPLSIQIDPEDGGRVYIRPNPHAPRALPGQYHALQCARQLILEAVPYVVRPDGLPKLCLITLGRILHDNLVPQALKLQALTLYARHPHERWPVCSERNSIFPETIPFNLAGLRDKFSAHWDHLTQLIIHIPGTKDAAVMLTDLVTRCILPHALRLEDFRYFFGPGADGHMGRVLRQLAFLDPHPPLKRFEANVFDTYEDMSDLPVVLQAYGRTLETVTVLNPWRDDYLWREEYSRPDHHRVLELKAACPALAQVLGRDDWGKGQVRWKVLSGPAELYEQRPRDDDGSLEWVRVDGSAQWQGTFTHVCPL
ncbi:hypothetical protein BP00DRAFT_448763 [Aspergillus indologenus CBS 114.80]|uniref:F-box domain-containing protein n=1 Tax=Aspergillus indologenus CBS 114.80 TaxID=1450541 RepID=A0A2V5I4C3_9EURO|nr:hypothetical protein BP00DRAFT_448763 [Aspergillus indologenus CBS 114.80]